MNQTIGPENFQSKTIHRPRERLPQNFSSIGLAVSEVGKFTQTEKIPHYLVYLDKRTCQSEA